MLGANRHLSGLIGYSSTGIFLAWCVAFYAFHRNRNNLANQNTLKTRTFKEIDYMYSPIQRFSCCKKPKYACADPGIFVRGVQVSLTKKKKKKSSDNVFFFFFFFFLVLRLFYSSQMVYFKEIYHFSRDRGGPTFSRGGSNFFQGGGGGVSNSLFPKETHITCDFPGGGRTPCPPPLWIRTCYA